MPDATPAWRQAPEAGSRSAVRALGWIARNAPDRIRRAIVWLIALWFTTFPGAISEAGTRAYFTRLTGRAPGFGTRFHQCLTFAHVVLDRVALLSGGLAAFDIRTRGEEIVELHHNAGRGGILLGAHFGSFEALRAFDRTLPGLRVRYLMYQDNAEQTSALLDGLNPDVAAQIIPVSDGQAAMLAVREALDRAEFVAFLGDRMPETRDRAAIAVPFLGEDIAVPRAPYVSALLAQVPLILCFAPRTGNRQYEIEFQEIYDGAPIPRSDRDGACRALAGAFAAALEGMCRRHPDNWFNFFDIWGDARHLSSSHREPRRGAGKP